MNISGFTEKQAREKIGVDKCFILDVNGFEWLESLPYSMVEGWTNGKCSFIFDEDKGLLQTKQEMLHHIVQYG